MPELFRAAGYATFNRGKDDYNFSYDRNRLYSLGVTHDEFGWKGPSGGGDWRDVPQGVPFFGQVQLSGGKHLTARELKERSLVPVDPDGIVVPPQYPDIPEIRREIANHLDTIRVSDFEVGRLIDRLKADGLWDNTIGPRVGPAAK